MTEVIWAAAVGGLVLAIGVVRIVRARPTGLDKLIVLATVFYAAPLAAFGTEHFTLTEGIASLVPSWMPWPELWVYAIGAGFIAAAVSMASGILASLSATLVASTFLVFVAAMDAPAWAEDPADRIALTLALRELAFAGGALALAASLARPSRAASVLATGARIAIAVPILVYSVEQFLHGDRVPAIPLDRLTPVYVVGHAIWTYVVAAVYAVAGVLLLVGRRRYQRAAALWLGSAVLLVVLVVYVPICLVEGPSLENFNFLADTLMFCGAVFLVLCQTREA